MHARRHIPSCYPTPHTGIGLAVLKALAGAGANVAMHGLGDRSAVTRLQQQIAAETGVRVLYSDADLRQPHAIRETVARVAGELGGLDILHNNAGTFYDCVCRRPEILLQGSHCTKLNRTDTAALQESSL